jgi:hypothetical protein
MSDRQERRESGEGMQARHIEQGGPRRRLPLV